MTASRAADYLDDTGAWLGRCAARMRERDPLLLPDDVAALVADMSTRQRWREMRPEDAADLAFEPKRIRSAW